MLNTFIVISHETSPDLCSLICLCGVEKINLAELLLSYASIFYPAVIKILTYKKLL